METFGINDTLETKWQQIKHHFLHYNCHLAFEKRNIAKYFTRHIDYKILFFYNSQ